MTKLEKAKKNEEEKQKKREERKIKFMIDKYGVVREENEEVRMVLKDPKTEFPRLQKWENVKILTFLAKNWSKADIIQEK